MKWFLSVCVLGGIVAVLSSSSCGPKRDFCPTNVPEYTCFDRDGGGMGGAGGQDLGPCDGATPIVCLNGTKVCNQSECP
jgi:hypothetical protein